MVKKIVLTEGIDNRYFVNLSDGDSVYPMILYRTPEAAVARVMQLLDIKTAITPQDYPERVMIGEIEESD
jgi:hypothetical protein